MVERSGCGTAERWGGLLRFVPPATVAAFALAMLAVHLPWAAGNPAPHGRDESLHLRTALVVARAVAENPLRFLTIAAGDFPPSVRQSVYPPLPYLVVAPVKTALLSHADDYLASLGALTLFSLILGVSTYVAAQRLAGGGAWGALFGMGAAAAVLLSPLVFDQTHHFGPNLPATAMTALCLALLLSSEDFSRGGRTLAFAVTLGLAMLCYYTVFLFLAGPVAAALLARAREGGPPPRARRALRLAVTLLVALAICLPFYVRSGIHVKLAGYWTLFFGGVRPVAEESDLARGAGLWPALFYYPRTMIARQLTPIPAALTLVGALLAFVRRVSGRWGLALSVLIPWIAFTAFTSKWPERTLPAVPPTILLAVAGFAATGGRRAFGLLLTALLTLAMLPGGMGVTLRETGRLRSQEDITFRDLAGPFREMAAREGITRATPDGAPPLVGVAHEQMLFEYAAELAGVPCRVVQAKTSPDFFSRFGEMRMVAMIRDGPEGPDWFTREYLEWIAGMRTDLGPIETARRLADGIVAARPQFEEIYRGKLRGATFIFYLRTADPPT